MILPEEDPTIEQDIHRIIGTAAEAQLLQRAIEVITRLRLRVEEQAQGLREARKTIQGFLDERDKRDI